MVNCDNPLKFLKENSGTSVIEQWDPLVKMLDRSCCVGGDTFLSTKPLRLLTDVNQISLWCQILQINEGQLVHCEIWGFHAPSRLSL